jgi:hypothetical protein
VIVVTSPTGTIGKQVLENVLKSGEPIRVTWDGGSRGRRAGHGVIGDGRPDREHGGELPDTDDALVHG